jgi:Ca2+/H+ antiporter
MKKVLAISLLTPGAALAHGGHGAESQAHWLAQADHLVVVLLAAAIVLPPVIRLAAAMLTSPPQTKGEIHE